MTHNKKIIDCYIGLGSNLNNPKQQMYNAINLLRAIADTTLIKVSKLYWSTPLGPKDQPDYINAVALINSQLSLYDLHSALLNIEKSLGKIKTIPNGPRIIDLDILLYGNMLLRSPTIEVPHPGLETRDFVLQPLHDISPNLVLPNGHLLSYFLNNCKDSYIYKVEPFEMFYLEEHTNL